MSTITTAEQELSAVRRIAETDALNSVTQIKSELTWLAESLSSAVDALEELNPLAYIEGLSERDIVALYRLTGAVSTIVQGARALSTASGRIHGNANILTAIKSPSE